MKHTSKLAKNENEVGRYKIKNADATPEQNYQIAQNDTKQNIC